MFNMPSNENKQPKATRSITCITNTEHALVINRNVLCRTISNVEQPSLHMGSAVLTHITHTPNTTMNYNDGSWIGTNIHGRNHQTTQITRHNSKQQGPKVHITILDRNTLTTWSQTGKVNSFPPSNEWSIQKDDQKSITNTMDSCLARPTRLAKTPTNGGILNQLKHSSLHRLHTIWVHIQICAQNDQNNQKYRICQSTGLHEQSQRHGTQCSWHPNWGSNRPNLSCKSKAVRWWQKAYHKVWR